ncbi:gluconate 2-dehydrogenase subunit 3 family protein [Flavivirga spongiicola]|uniref:Gluconate 2-dehydrogenase subunit 3 family protein n=1 Tax=Flavivirga spongiicola TaxID=421621 RepID=A0ABU7XUS0_9FLAO|nr:gluconate 2-dehydrogenase subunit 3 family protein [Flavivirga sp. MEBiC05379]MDO5979526.1 gluconate 2-dehydrogenase subunit 3 family protein [Flavivirga sp. MEBiC05379]
MNRRDVLKGLGLSLGYAIATPGIMSMLQSCKTEASLWVPKLLSIDEGIVITNLIDLILPKTDATPGALDVNVPEFLDLYAFKTYDEKRKKTFKKGINGIMKALNINEDNSVAALKTEDYDALLAKYLKASKEQQELYRQEEDKENKDVILFNALSNLRSSSIWAYKNSELIGEQVLAYDPIPGLQIGCGTIEETSGGKAWSL